MRDVPLHHTLASCQALQSAACAQRWTCDAELTPALGQLLEASSGSWGQVPWACWPQPCCDTCALVFILAPPHGLAAIATTIPTESLGSCMTTVAQAVPEVAAACWLAIS